MMPSLATPRKVRRAKSEAQSKSREAIQLTAVYDEPGASCVTGVASITLRRAVDAGHLRIRRIGRRRFYLGSDLLAWIEAGGRTGRSSIDVQLESTKAA